jgi:hypothetical protein
MKHNKLYTFRNSSNIISDLKLLPTIMQLKESLFYIKEQNQTHEHIKTKKKTSWP